MVAYNFQAQFVDKIRSGDKRHTIRRNGRRRHARPGEMIQLYTGQRTKQCRKIISDQVCNMRSPIEIQVGATKIQWIDIGGMPVKTIDELESFAMADGFFSLSAMSQFWFKFHGLGLFKNASMIGWDYRVDSS